MRLVEVIKGNYIGKDAKPISMSDANIRKNPDIPMEQYDIMKLTNDEGFPIKGYYEYYSNHRTKVFSSSYFDYRWGKILNSDMNRISNEGGSYIGTTTLNGEEVNLFIVDLDHPEMTLYKSFYRDFQIKEILNEGI